ncbi:MAG: AEC family transporter [Pirellula sp.]
MNSNFVSIATTVSGVFLVMSMGALARYLKWFTSEVDRSMAGFTANVLLPSFFFHRVMTDPKLSTNLTAWTPALYGAGLTAMGFMVSVLVVRLVGRWFSLLEESEQRTFALCTGVANYGYLAFPLAEVFYPGCIVTLLVHNVGVDMALWSVGLFIISGHGLKKSWRRIVFSPPLLSVAVALSIRQFGGQPYIPPPLMHMTDQLGRCSIPMGLVLSGAILFDYAKKIDFSTAWKPLLLAMAVRLMLIPILFLLAARFLTEARDMREVLILQAAMPAATFPIVMTRLYNQSLETAWTVVVGTSVLGIFTIPIWMVLGAAWLGF